MDQQSDEQYRIMTIERHILEEQRSHPEATGTLTSLLYDMALAGKVIASKTTRAGLAEILGRTDEVNVQGEQVMKLDRLADLTIFRLNDHTGRLAALASEENADIMRVPDKYPSGKYILLYDPLDGSSNIDYNVPVGTIFSIYRRKSPDNTPANLMDCLQPGRDLVAAGYVAYGKQHNAGIYYGVRGSWVHLGSYSRGIFTLAPVYSHSRKTSLLQRELGLPSILEQGN
jgi:fructose-1,6-bisphosphatase I